jgi:general L-amino acid transport system substrate-binding protein
MAVSVACVSRGSSLGPVKARGQLRCGVEVGVAGFADVDASGRYAGLDVDVCRAVAAAIFGDPDRVRYLQASSVDELLHQRTVDIVSRRLTWSLTREGLGLLFGPVMFYDGQGFLIAKRLDVRSPRQLERVDICVDAGTLFEAHLASYFSANGLELRKVLIRSAADRVRALASGECRAYTADVSELGALRSHLPNGRDFDILPDLISKEPLAPVVRAEDVALFQVLRWTLFATINAEELGVTATNVDQMLSSRDPDVRRLLGVVPGNGHALGLDERWAYHVIKSVGNYGEMFDRDVGARSAVKLERGLNRLWTAGGLIFAPPLR